MAAMHDNLLYIIDRFARLGNETAYVFRRGYRRLHWSYGEVAATARRFARELEQRSVMRGDRVLLWGDNSAEWVAVFFGCMLLGAVVVPMDKVATAEFANRVARQVEAKLSVCSRDLAKATSAPTIILEELSESLRSHNAGRYDSPTLGRDDTLEIVFTSGTTAEPKGVVLSHGNVLANLEPIENEIAKYRKYERFVHPLRFVNLLPLSHVFGQFLGLFIPQALGATVIFHDSLNPAEVIRTIREERASVLITVPRLLDSLRQKIERDLEERGELQTFRQRFENSDGKHFLRRWWMFRRVHSEFGWKFWAFISGGAALDERTEQFWSRLAFAVVQGYGLTETTSLISVNHPFKVGKRSIGKVLPGREMKVDPQTGEILVRGSNVASGYWVGKGVVHEGEDDGWFRTGDLGEVDPEGNLYFKGRKKNVIVTREGMNIHPADLESALRRQPAVRDCVVVALPLDGNAEPCAVLLLAQSESAPEQAAAEAIRGANRQLADHQQIRRWLVWPGQDFPRTSTQKPKSAVIADYVLHHFAEGEQAPTTSSGTVAELIERITRRKVGELTPETNLESDLNLSSIDRVELMSALEDRLQTDLDETRVSQATTLGDLERMLGKAKSAQSPGPRLASSFRYPSWAQRWPQTWIRPAVYYALTWPATLLMAKPRVVGRENLRGFDGPALIVSNHVTYVDIGFVMAALPRTMRTGLAPAMQGERLIAMRNGRSGITGDRAQPNFFLRAVYKLAYALTVALFNVFPLPQRSGFRESFEFAGEAVDRGYSIVVFPEGRRTENGELQPFQTGVGLLATKLNLPVIPMRIDGLWQAAQEGKHFVRPGTITVRIGKPVRYAPNTAPETIARNLERRVREL